MPSRSCRGESDERVGRRRHGQRLGLADDAAGREVLAEFGVASEVRVVSAHRTPREMLEYGATAADRGLRVVIAGAGGAAHLPGMLASVTPLPVIGVPVPLAHLDGIDSLLSIVQMPAGVPVATVSIGGARNAGLLAVRILGTYDDDLRAAMTRFQAGLADTARGKDAALQRPARRGRVEVVTRACCLDGRSRRPGELLTWLPAGESFAFLRGGDGIVGWGEAARLPTSSAADVEELLGAITARDDVGLPGCGAVAIASLGFDPDRRCFGRRGAQGRAGAA